MRPLCFYCFLAGRNGTRYQATPPFTIKPETRTERPGATSLSSSSPLAVWEDSIREISSVTETETTWSVGATIKIISSLRLVLPMPWLSLKCLMSALMTSPVVEVTQGWVMVELRLEVFLEKEVVDYLLGTVEAGYLAMEEVEDCLEATLEVVTLEAVGMEVVVAGVGAVGARK